MNIRKRNVFDDPKYPQVKWLKRPSSRPYAGISTHDPDGNVFDLSQKDMNEKVGDFAAKIAAKGPDTVALLFYAYARGNRSSRGTERACWEDVAFKVITG